MKLKGSYRKIVISLLVLTLLMIPLQVYANSSWVWISEKRPYDLLPVVIVATLLIESLVINYIASIRQYKKVFSVVLLANLVSFLIPYLLEWINCIMIPIYDFSDSLEAGPFYNVGGLYLLCTLAAEVPIVYNLFKNVVTNKRRLMITIAAVNVITTVLVAIVERKFCYGSW